MPRVVRLNLRRARRPTFIRAWRRHRHLTLALVTKRMATEQQLSISEGQLSRIERGETPYSQDVLEALAAVLACEPADLLATEPPPGPPGKSGGD